MNSNDHPTVQMVNAVLSPDFWTVTVKDEMVHVLGMVGDRCKYTGEPPRIDCPCGHPHHAVTGSIRLDMNPAITPMWVLSMVGLHAKESQHAKDLQHFEMSQSFFSIVHAEDPDESSLEAVVEAEMLSFSEEFGVVTATLEVPLVLDHEETLVVSGLTSEPVAALVRERGWL